MFLHACLRVVQLWRMGCLVLCGFFLCFGGGAAAFAAPSVEEMAGQMLLVGFKGQEPEECGAILGDIQTRHLGGVILFKRDARNAKLPRNIRDAAQVKRLTAALRGASAGHPLFVAVDQEGGKVARFQPGDGFPGVPFGRGAGPGHARMPRAARPSAWGRMLRELGVNLNFAPVLDVNVYPLPRP